jgi:hypothetical protein
MAQPTVSLLSLRAVHTNNGAAVPIAMPMNAPFQTLSRAGGCAEAVDGMSRAERQSERTTGLKWRMAYLLHLSMRRRCVKRLRGESAVFATPLVSDDRRFSHIHADDRTNPALHCRHGPCSRWPRGLTDDGILRREPLEDAMAEQARLDVLEGRVEELSTHWHRLFGELGRLDQKVDAVAVVLGARIDTVDRRFDGADRRFEGLDRRFEALEQKIDRRFEAVDRQFLDLRAELSRQFRWTFSTMLALLGMMLTVGAGVATALLRANP